MGKYVLYVMSQSKDIFLLDIIYNPDILLINDDNSNLVSGSRCFPGCPAWTLNHKISQVSRFF